MASESEKLPFSEQILRKECVDLADHVVFRLQVAVSEDLPEEFLRTQISDLLLSKQEEIVKKIEENYNVVLGEKPVEFENLVTVSNESLKSQTSHTLVVCVDGSSGGEQAFQTALHLLRPQDEIVLFHTYTGTNSRTRGAFSSSSSSDGGETPKSRPPGFTHEDIARNYESRLAKAVPAPRSHVCFFARSENETSRDALSSVISQFRRPVPNEASGDYEQLNFLVLGYSGRNNQISETLLMGSKVQHVIRTVHLPVIICKSVCPANAPIHYLYAANMSISCQRGLDTLLTLVKPWDRVTIIHFAVPPENSENSAAEEFQTYFKSELAENGPMDSSVDIIALADKRLLVDELLKQVEARKPDFLVLAPRPKDTPSSITEEVTRRCPTSVVLCMR